MQKKLIVILILLIFLFGCMDSMFGEPGADAVDIYNELINDPINQYALSDSTITTLDTIPIISVNIGNEYYFYQYSRDIAGGLPSPYKGIYRTKIINTSADSQQTIISWYAFIKFTHPILMDDSSFTFRGETVYEIGSSYDYYTILINTIYGPLYYYEYNKSSEMDSRSKSIVYLTLNKQAMPTGKMCNEYYEKEKLLTTDNKWINK